MQDLPFKAVYSLTEKGDIEGVTEAVKNHPGLLSITTPGHNRTLLWIATRKNREEILKFLLKQGADVNIRGQHQTTALHMAARAGINQVVEILVSHGADVTALTDTGKTPLDLAKKARRFDTVSLLEGSRQALGSGIASSACSYYRMTYHLEEDVNGITSMMSLYVV